MKLFDLDSPIIRALTRMTDLLILNMLALLCCIPIVTAGASFTALHYMSLKLVRKEETYVVRGFFKSFKENFKQATIIWLLFLLTIAVLVGDFLIMENLESFNMVIKVIITVAAIIVLFTGTFLFPILAKFDNTVFQTIKNAFVISVLQFPKTIAMFILNWLPWILMLTVMQIAPLCIFFGFSVPAYVSAFMYNKFFKKLEEQIIEKNGPASEEDTGEDERIFKDELDESIFGNNNIH